MFRNYLLLVVLTTELIGSTAAGAATRPLHSFTAILSALEKGEVVRTVFHFKRCSMQRDGEVHPQGPNAIGAIPIEAFEYFAPGTFGSKNGLLVFSKSVLIGHPRYGFVTNYGRVRVTGDGKVEITAQFLDTKTNDVKMDEIFRTTIDDGSGTAGASFFVLE